ncbi:MAG TPA: hypothetical protein VHB20_03715 [Verrucomicrobiae bacterium]|jgi:hypothetical protein|nr:hypothetical protein [Verrucomicrobiae bacterium]
MNLRVQFSILCGIAGVALAAPGQTTNMIFGTDFDGGSGNGNFQYGYATGWAGTDAGGGLGAVFNYLGVVANAGVDGSSALEASPDYTELATDPGWLDATSWAACHLNLVAAFGAPINPISPLSLTSATNSLILRAQCETEGLVSGQYGANISIWELDFLDASGNIIFNFNGYGTWAATNGFSVLSVNLANLAYGGQDNPNPQNPITDFTNADVVASIASFKVVFAAQDVEGGPGSYEPVFGFTDTGLMIVDNVELDEVSTAPPPAPTPTVPYTIWGVDFDSALPTGYPFPWASRDSGISTPVAQGYIATGGVGGSAFSETMADLSSWESDPPNNYSNFGTGVNEVPVAPAAAFTLVSPSSAKYAVYLSAMVSGLAPGTNSVPGTLDVNFFVPTSYDPIVDMQGFITLTTNWQSYVVTNLTVNPYYPVGGQASFNRDYTNISSMELQLGIDGTPDAGLWFAYSTEATIAIDNVRFVEFVPELPKLTIAQTNGVQIFWADPPAGAGTAQLQSSTNISGPYVDIAGASSAATASPYIVPPSGPQLFFRASWVP